MPDHICKNCNIALELKSGISKKTGNAYSFWGCPSYPKCVYTEWNEKKAEPQTQNRGETSKQKSALLVLNEILLEQKKIREALSMLNERLDAMATPQ